MCKAVFIVEDDPFIAIDLQDAIEDAGFDVIGPVATVQSGLRKLENARPDIALLDYNLGSETSAEIARRLKDMNIPFIFASGQIDKVITDDVPESVALIPKPFLIETVLEIVKRLISEEANI